MGKKGWFRIYGILFLVICLLPSAGLLAGGGESGSLENRELAAPPRLRTEEGGWNVDVLTDAGAWFEDHFAFRSHWVTAYAGILRDVFHVSAQDSVIVGEEGWLYYWDSLEDYQGAGLLSERQLFNIAHTLRLMQDFTLENGSDFVFTVAPNKNSLYGEHMPYYYRGFRTNEHNVDNLWKWLEKEGVNSIDLKSVLDSEEEVLYHKSDSHWDNRGAALAADEILTWLELPHRDYREAEYQVREDFEGDLAKMLTPADVSPEAEYYYEPEPAFTYVTEVESNFDPSIETAGEGEGGNLVMYRDSFGNALLPFMAEAFSTAYFSRGVPYYMDDIFDYDADALVIEKAERFLPELAANPPMMVAPEAETDAEFTDEIEDLLVDEENVYLTVSGLVPEEDLQTESRIYIRVNGEEVFEAFPYTDEEGRERFQAALPDEAWTGDDVFEIAVSGA